MPLPALVAAIALLLLIPTAARAADGAPGAGLRTVAPAPGAKLPRGATIAVRVRPAAPPLRLRIVVAAAPDTDASGRLVRGVVEQVPAAPGDPEWTARIGRGWSRRPGPYWYQAQAIAPGDGAALVEHVGPVRTLAVTQPAARRGRGRLHGRFGARGRVALAISTAGRPPGVAKRRWVAIVRTAALRWGLRVAGVTPQRVRTGDGRITVGFGAGVPPFALALQRDLRARGRVLDRDVIVRPDLPWQAGPGYPSIDQFDLESVLLHELGHLAGNKRHRARCANHVLAASLGSGEWWRGPRDSWRFGCSAALSVD